MAATAQLKGKVSLNTRAFRSKIRRIKRNVRKFGHAMRKMGRIAKTSLTAFAVAATAAVTAVYKLTKATANSGDKLQKMALRTSLTVKNLEELNYIAQITGTEVDLLQKGVKQMARAISYARDGLKTYTREFKKMGLSVKDFEGLSATEIFEKITTAMSGMTDEVQQAATAATLFGRSGQMLIPMLKMEGKSVEKLRDRFGELAYKFGREGADSAAAFNDAMTDLKFALAGVRNKVVLGFLDMLEEKVGKFAEKVAELREKNYFVHLLYDWGRAVIKWTAESAKNIYKFWTDSKIIFRKLKLNGAIAFDEIRSSVARLSLFLNKKTGGGLQESLKVAGTRFVYMSAVARKALVHLKLSLLRVLQLSRRVYTFGFDWAERYDEPIARTKKDFEDIEPVKEATGMWNLYEANAKAGKDLVAKLEKIVSEADIDIAKNRIKLDNPTYEVEALREENKVKRTIDETAKKARVGWRMILGRAIAGEEDRRREEERRQNQPAWLSQRSVWSSRYSPAVAGVIPNGTQNERNIAEMVKQLQMQTGLMSGPPTGGAIKWGR